MHTEGAICPLCFNEIYVKVPTGHEIGDVFFAKDIFIPLDKKYDRQTYCLQCGLEVFIRFREAQQQAVVARRNVCVSQRGSASSARPLSIFDQWEVKDV